MSIAAGWHAASGETPEMWHTETRNIPDTLRDLADWLDANPGALLYALTNNPTEPSAPDLFVMQVTISRLTE